MRAKDDSGAKSISNGVAPRIFAYIKLSHIITLSTAWLVAWPQAARNCLQYVQTKADWDVLTPIIFVQRRFLKKRGLKTPVTSYDWKHARSHSNCGWENTVARGNKLTPGGWNFSGHPPKCLPAPHAPHNIIAWPKRSHGNTYFIPSHVSADHFSTRYYAGRISVVLLALLLKQQQFPALVA